ncbi:MAG TPA: SIMPL domain-containing protein [Marinobacter sp.]|nr:SIMPL domain-containing protein [Marinobacter sp.]
MWLSGPETDFTAAGTDTKFGVLVMNKRNLLASGVLSCMLLLPGLTLAGEVSLSAQGSVSYEPDSARLQFTASAENELPQKATQQVTALMNQWREGIKKYRSRLNNYTDANVTLYTRVIPAEKRGDEPLKRAVASQTVSFEIADLALLNPLLEQAQALGLDYQLNPNQFFHSDEASLQRKALANAIAEAREKCKFVASQLDQTCGEVINININSGMRPMPMMMASAKREDSVVSSIGEQQIEATVNATFKLN